MTQPIQNRLATHVAILRLAFGAIWAVNAALKWMPSFASSFLDSVNGGAQGQPAWLGPWFHFWSQVLGSQPQAFASLVAVLESAIAIALITGFARRTIYLGAAAMSLLIWAIPQGFGGPYTSASTDIGAGIVYAMVFFALYGLERLATPARWAVDNLIIRKLPWWSVVASP
ncbi:MAG TPA: hypothetical protein VMT30_05115 [Candidatus Saccharimonadia bacterium]|nr:hypothetical protein [Candidatus Saccharimonadia bacterium]